MSIYLQSISLITFYFSLCIPMSFLGVYRWYQLEKIISKSNVKNDFLNIPNDAIIGILFHFKKYLDNPKMKFQQEKKKTKSFSNSNQASNLSQTNEHARLKDVGPSLKITDRSINHIHF